MSERTAEEWGRVAVGLPGWRWMPGMLDDESGRRVDRICDCGDPLWVALRELADRGYCGHHAEWGSSLTHKLARPDPDDPTTAGCLLAMLGDGWSFSGPLPAEDADPESDDDKWVLRQWRNDRCDYADPSFIGPTLGRACIAAAEALGRWPEVAP